MLKLTSKKIYILSILSIAMVFGFLIVSDVYYSWQNIRQQIVFDAKNNATYIEELENQIVTILSSISKNPILKSKDSDLITEFLFSVNTFPQVNSLVLANKDGIRWAGSKRNVKPFDVSKSEFFRGVMTTKKPYVAGVSISKLSGSLEIIIGYPIFDNNNAIENVFYSTVRITKQFENLDGKLSLNSGGTMQLIDGRNNVLLSNSEPASKIEKFDFHKRFSSFSKLDSFDNILNKNFMVMMPVEGTDWKIILEKSFSDIVKQIAKEILTDMGLNIFAILPIILFAFIAIFQLNKQKEELLLNNSILKNLAYSDALTGLLNHRSFQDKLEDCIAEAGENKPLSLIMLDIENFKIINNQYGHQNGDKILQVVSSILTENIGNRGIIARYGGDEFVIILPETHEQSALDTASLLSKLISDTQISLGDNSPIKLGVSLGIASYPKNASDKENLIRFANQALFNAQENSNTKIHVYYSALEELRGNLAGENDVLNLIYTLNTIINAKDKYTFAHCDRVKRYAVMIAKALNLSSDQVKNISIGALLHDIGKIETSGEILNKPGQLTEDEFSVIKQHPVIGNEIIKPVKSLTTASDFILCHHERYDGKGYPQGLKGEEIPLVGRIAAVADSFDAMTSNRPYQKPRTVSEAIDELKKCSGTQFDPTVVDTFIKVLEKEGLEELTAN